VKTVGIIAGGGRVPVLGVRAARERGWRVHAVALASGLEAAACGEALPAGDPCAALAEAGAECETIPIHEYERIVAAFTGRGVRDVYILGKVPKTALFQSNFAPVARRVLSARAGQGDHPLIEAFVADMGRRGLAVRPQSELFAQYVVPAGFGAGRPLTDREQADVRYGYMVARRLADAADAGQTVVVKDGIVLALEAAEGTDATIRRGGQLGGPGAVVVKVKGRRAIDLELPAVGLDTVAAMAAAGAAVLAVEAERVLLLEREATLRRVEELGIALVTVAGDERS